MFQLLQPIEHRIHDPREGDDVSRYLLHLAYEDGTVVTLGFPHASLRGFAAIRYAQQLGVMLCFEDR